MSDSSTPIPSTADSLAAILRAQAAYPELTFHGIGLCGHCGDDEAVQQVERKRMLTPGSVARFERVRPWLEAQRRTVHVNRRTATSYGLKEQAEKETGGYISNGMFIAAAHACGYVMERVDRRSVNVWLNISAVRPPNPNLAPSPAG